MLRIIILLSIMLLASPAMTASGVELTNQLQDHPSPYLAMHQDDPVQWQTWSQATLDKARQLNRPLLVSIGYFSCHWCHVMQRESFQNVALASLINASFIPVKVDRELQPALDAYLIDFVRRTRGRAGWPLNVFLTPDGYPLVGATYLPREQFSSLLRNLQQRWKTGSSELTELARTEITEWRQMRDVAAARQPADISFSQQLRAQTERMKDDMAGGFGQQAKFPMVAQMRALLWLREYKEQRSFDEFIRLTLDSMADQGLHDLVGGGFFRYTTDPAWMRPHYEKMLYDNAQLACLYLRAAQQFQSRRYQDIGLSTVDFMINNMRSPEGYFISSFSAVDEQGREGYYYQWDESTLESLLDESELKAVKVAWFGAQDSDSEFGRLPRRQASLSVAAQRLKWPQEKLEPVLASARGKLLEARRQRSLPADNKGLAAWNGLVLSALAEAYRVSGEPAYAAQAAALASWILERWWDGKRLVRTLQAEREPVAATLEDYALVAQGLWDWSHAKPGGVDKKIIEQLLRSAWQHFFVDNRWVLSDAPLIPMLGGRIAMEDGALPSASAVMADLSMRLDGLRSDQAVQDGVNAHLVQVRGLLGGSALWYASYLEPLARSQTLR